MGSTLSGILGTDNGFQATNPYSGADFQKALQDQKNVFNSEWAQSNAIYDNFQSPNAMNPAQVQYLQNTQNLAQQQATQNAQNRAMNPGAAARLSGQQAIAGGQQAAGQASINQMNQMAMGQQMQNNLLGTMGSQAFGQAHDISQNQQSVNGMNAGVSAQNAQTAGQIVGGVMNAAGGAAGLMNQGGKVPGYAEGGFLMGKGASLNPYMPAQAQGPNPFMMTPGKKKPKEDEVDRNGMGKQFNAPVATPSLGVPGMAPMMGQAPGLGVDTSLGSLSQMQAGLARGGSVGSQLKAGGRVPGEAMVSGDSPKNDTVHAMLSPDEIVVKRSAATSRDKAKEFIDHLFDHMEKEKGGEPEEEMSFGKVLAARKTAGEYSKKVKKKD